MSERLPTTLPQVTERQREVARLVAEGLTNEQIAERMGISLAGAKYHVSELLGRLGLARREEIAAWYRAQGSEAPPRPWSHLRSLLGVPALALGGGAAAAAVLIAIVFVFEGALGSGSEHEESPAAGSSPSPAVVADYVVEHAGDGWESRAVSDLESRDLLFLLYEVDAATAVHVLDRATGERVGEITTDGDGPNLVVGRESGRLIVLDRMWEFGSSGAATANRPRLLVFDVAGNLALEAEIDQLGNLNGGVHWWNDRGLLELGQFMLSTDERYLYYHTWGNQQSPNVIGIVDLEDGTLERATTRCVDPGDGPRLVPASPSGVVAACTTSRQIQRIAPNGSITDPIEVGGVAGVTDASTFLESEVPIAAAFDAPGGIGVLYQDGTYAVIDDTGTALHIGRALPDHAPYLYRAWSGPAIRLDRTRLALPYYDDLPGPQTPAAGVAIFNIESTTIEQDIAFDHHGSYPVGERTIAFVGSERIDIFDLDAMQVVESFAAGHPDAPGVLPAVR